MTMELNLYNTSSRSLERFRPIKDGQVGLYCCGPTVYKSAHIGNLRAYVFEDVLRRTLEYAGYAVNHVMNVTDVGHLSDDGDEGEDKMIQSAREQGLSVWDIARMYTGLFFRDAERLNITRPVVVCNATEHIPEMIALVQKLEQKGFTYQAGGNVYFDISRFGDYGRMAKLRLDEQQAGARIEVDAGKKNPQDFVLWFTQSKFEHQAMLWDSPWGKGYPGWHLECSAMSLRYLGEQFDIHCGGVDHVNVHHTNEIAQSEAATGKSPWVRYWLHGEFLLLDRAKMSKSSGGFITLDNLVEAGYEPLDYRYFLLGGHYRSQLSFSFDNLEAARNARRGIVDRLRNLEEGGTADLSTHAAQQHLSAFEDALADDLNMPKALAQLWLLLRDRAVDDATRRALALRMDRVLGLDLGKTGNKSIDAEIEALIKERNEARASKNFARSDEIRDLLKERGIVLEDTPAGTRWKNEKV